MTQTVIPKDSQEEISLGDGLIVVGLLDSISINNNYIIYGIPNRIPSSSSLPSVVKKYKEATFMSIA